MEVGDIIDQETEAIVNAANSSLLGGGGVDGAIHQAGGPEILAECKEIRKNRGKCPPGEAVLTSSGKLKSNYVIHTVGPVWSGGDDNEPDILKNSYQNSLIIARDNKISSIAFPSISTGAYKYPVYKAAKVALSTLKNYAENNVLPELIKMILHSNKDYNTYREVWENHIIS